MRAPLGVRIRDVAGDDPKNVTRFVSGLSYTKTAFGGDVDLSCRLVVPRNTFDDLGPGDQIEVFDTRTADTVWSGNIDHPGVTRDFHGEEYDLQAFGSAARLQAAKQPLGYVVTRLEVFHRSSNCAKGAQTRIDELPTGEPTLQVSAAEGKNIALAWQGEWITKAFRNAELKIGRARADVVAGVPSQYFDMQLRSGNDVENLALAATRDANVTRGSISAYRGGTAAGENGIGDVDLVAFRVARTDTVITATDDHWFEFYNIVVRQVLLGRRGNVVDGVYDRNHVFAHEVIADMLGRGMFPGVNPEYVTLPTTDYPIDSLDWLDGVTMGDALDQLAVFEPALWWRAHGRTFDCGLFHDGEIRYVIGKKHRGINLPGQEISLCNRIAVTWTDNRGEERVTVVRRPIEGLNYTRDAQSIDLPDGMGSVANAQRVGEKALELLNDPPRAGSAVIRTTIRDHWQGLDVWPHEVEPGCRVRDAETGQTFRLTEVAYDDEDGAATLTLGDPVRTVEQYVARLHRRQRRRRRRRR